MKDNLAIDTDHAINIYITSVQTGYENIKGWAILPDNHWAINENNNLFGVIIQPSVLPSGSDAQNNLGKVATHEVGHYFGLLHTFFDDLCKSNSDPDKVADTPPHLANTGCPPDNTNTCPAPGFDPVHNYMNYTNDICRYQFTPGQIMKMYIDVDNYKPFIGETNINIKSNRTINSGDSWKFVSGNYRFSPGVTLTVNGTLNATSTTFTSSTTSNYWGGIIYNSGSSGDLNGCTISRVQTSAGGAAITINNSATVAVRFCSITNNNTGTTSGINIIGGGNRNILQNAINSFSNHGIYFYQGNAQLRYNNISGAQTGKAAVYCNYYSTPLFGGTSNPFEGRNTLQNSYMGLYANNNCNINAGASGFANNNRFVNNTSANIYAANNTTVGAQYAWWGSYPPNYKITAILNSTVNSSNPLQSDPGAMFKPVKGGGFDNMLASQLYKPGVPEDYTPGDYKKLIPDLWAQYRNSKDPGIISQLNALVEKKSDPDLVRPLALEVLSFIYAYDNKIKEAILLNEKLINEYKGLVHEKNGLMNLFFIYYDAQDYKNAEAALSRIDKVYSSNEEVMLARWLLNKDKVDITKPHESIVSETTLPEEYGLSANYPNPFNPTTIINYNLPNDGFVSLKVYDILGNEVAELINDVRSAGSYNVEFNASNLASGVYIYRIQVRSSQGGIYGIKKNDFGEVKAHPNSASQAGFPKGRLKTSEAHPENVMSLNFANTPLPLSKREKDIKQEHALRVPAL